MHGATIRLVCKFVRTILLFHIYIYIYIDTYDLSSDFFYVVERVHDLKSSASSSILHCHVMAALRRILVQAIYILFCHVVLNHVSLLKHEKCPHSNTFCSRNKIQFPIFKFTTSARKLNTLLYYGNSLQKFNLQAL